MPARFELATRAAISIAAWLLLALTLWPDASARAGDPDHEQAADTAAEPTEERRGLGPIIAASLGVLVGGLLAARQIRRMRQS